MFEGEEGVMVSRSLRGMCREGTRIICLQGSTC